MSDTILAIEASSETCSVALLSHDMTYHDSNDTPRGHAQNILPMIDGLFAQANISANDVDVIAVTNGPGAFTSVRIGVAVCQGLAMAIKCPVISVSSLAVLAYQAMRESNQPAALVALDARMDEVYFGAYQMNDNGLPEAIRQDIVAKPDDIATESLNSIKNFAASGMGWQAYSEQMNARFSDISFELQETLFPSARYLLQIGKKLHELGVSQDVHSLVPVYLRDNVVHG